MHIIIYGVLLLVLAAAIFCLYKFLRWLYERYGRLALLSIVILGIVALPLALFFTYRYAFDADLVSPSTKIDNVRYSEAFDNGKRGLMVRYDITCYHLKGRNIINSIEVLGNTKNGFYYLEPISQTTTYRSRRGRAGISRTEYCDSNYKKWKDYSFFIPYDELSHVKGDNKFRFYLWIDYQKRKDPSSEYEHIYSDDANYDSYFFSVNYDKASADRLPAVKTKTQQKPAAQKSTQQKAATQKTDANETDANKTDNKTNNKTNNNKTNNNKTNNNTNKEQSSTEEEDDDDIDIMGWFFGL